MSKDFVVIVRGERAVEWERVLGTSEIAVRSPVPTRANLPSKPNALIYEMDLATLTATQRASLIDHLAAKFDLPAADVAAEIDRLGVPVLADDTMVRISNPQRWL